METDWQYRFNGQEWQDELGLNWYTYRYRNYDPTYARFFGVDPVSEDYYNITTYQFAHNNPVWKIEIEGLEGAPTTGTDIQADAGNSWSITDYAAGAWGAAGNMLMGAVTSTYSGIESGITETGKVIDAYNEGGLGAAVEQYGQSVYETSGAKGLVDTGSAALNGDANAQGQGVVVLAAAVILHKAGGKTSTSSENKVHGNSKASTKAQHNYDIVNTQTGEIVKTGTSGGKLNQDGSSKRGNQQANKWNKNENSPGKYKATVTNKVPEGKGARQKALDYEKKRAEQLREQNQLQDRDKHKRP